MLIDEMSKEELQKTLHEICDMYGIGRGARSPMIINENIKNSKRRSECLWEIEKYHSVLETDEDGEEYEVSKLNWGEEPGKYIKTYREILEVK